MGLTKKISSAKQHSAASNPAPLSLNSLQSSL